MARPLRIEYPGACYHVTARGNERKPIYRDDADREQFLARLAEVVSRYRLVVHAYVLMRNHYHLLVETREGNLGQALRQLNGVYTQDFNRRHRREGHLFQGRYKALLVDKDTYLVELSGYLHLNPVRVGEVTDPARFRWSSAAAYVGRQAMPAYLTVAEVLAYFGSRRAVAQRRYQEFLRAGRRQGAPAPWAAVIGQTLLGAPQWVERMRRRVGQRAAHPEVLGGRQLQPRPALAAILTRVARAAGVSREAIVRPTGRRHPWARPAAIYLGWEVGGLGQRELATEFGVSHFAVSKAIRRLQELRETDARVAKVIDGLVTTFQT